MRPGSSQKGMAHWDERGGYRRLLIEGRHKRRPPDMGDSRIDPGLLGPSFRLSRRSCESPPGSEFRRLISVCGANSETG